MLAAASSPSAEASSIAPVVMSIVSDLCPQAMLCGAFGLGQGAGLLPALGVIALSAASSSWTMLSLGDLAHETGSTSLSQVTGRLLGPGMKRLADLSLLVLSSSYCLSYAAFLGDALTTLPWEVYGLLLTRSQVLWSISAAILLPLCLLLSHALTLPACSAVSLLGILAVIELHLSKLAHSAKTMLPSSPFPIPLLPFGQGGWLLVQLFSTAFISHSSALSYHHQVQGKKQAYRKAVFLGFAATALVFAGMMVIGQQLYGPAAMPSLLDNLPILDKWATCARLASILAVSFNFPSMFSGAESALVDLLPSSSTAGTTIAMIGAFASVAAVYREEQLLMALNIVRSVLGSFLAFMLPAALRIAHLRQRERAGLKPDHRGLQINRALLVGGGVCALVGSWISWAF